MKNKFKTGFTLAELMIALVILGVIAALAIPKILTSLNSSNATKFKDIEATLAQAFQAAKLQKTFTLSTTFGDMLEYLNYSSVDTSSSFTTPSPLPAGWGEAIDPPCDPTSPCLVFPGNVYVQYEPGQTFGSLDANGGFIVNVDVDGTGTNAGAGSVVLTYTGRTVTPSNAGFLGDDFAPGSALGNFFIEEDPAYFNQ